jgi:formylglycine-generating enzyme required for sulfatase activity
MIGNECLGGDCCESPLVTGGTFSQGPDPVDSTSFQTSVGNFRLDRFEVTVSRFRRFVAKYDAWRGAGNPVAGSGANPSVSGSGWEASFSLPADAATLTSTSGVKCTTFATWVDDSGNENLPMNCVDWVTAFAFCIWDGGRLPTESELEYASAGGSQKRPYPWGSTPVPTDMQDLSAVYANYDCMGDGSAPGSCSFADILPIGSKTAGRGLYGQDDLAGSVWEWALDFYAPYPTTTTNDYARLDSGTERVVRGGSYLSNATALPAADRGSAGPGRHDGIGFRCARAP